MKKVLYLAVLATPLFFSCAKEIDSQTEDVPVAKIAFTASIENLNAPTKADINADRQLVWAKGDKIGVFTNNTWVDKNQPFTLVGDGGSVTGGFAWDYGDFNVTTANAAFFPWQGIGLDKNNVSGDNLYIKYPGSYSSYTSGKMMTPLGAEISRAGDAYAPICFKHAGAAVKLTINNLPAGAHSAGLTIAGKQIRGDYHIALSSLGADGTDGNLVLDAAENTSLNSVWLDYDPANTERAFTFLFPVPYLAKNSALTFTIYDKNDVKVWEATGYNKENALNHCNVLAMPALDITPYSSFNTSSSWYVHASLNNSGDFYNYSMVTDGSLSIARGLTFTAGGKFTVTDGSTYIPEGYGNDWVVNDAGTYDIIFNPAGATTSEKIKVVASGCPYPHKNSITGATALGASETANCYVIDTPGAYKIPVVKGNSNVSAGEVGGAQILWETINNNTAPGAHSIIAAIDFDDADKDHIYFKTPDDLQPGNALIAAKDASGNIIWSWHIWIPQTAYTTSTYGYIYNHEMMDRNLGALVAATTSSVPVESFGLLYEWGRKDPFVGARSISDNHFARISGTEMTKDYGMTVEQTIANPTVYAVYTKEDSWGPWLNPNNANLWKDGEKTIYDPCPAGYRVPARNTSQPMHGSNLSTVTGWSDNAAAGDNAAFFTLGDPVTVFPYTGMVCENGNYIDHLSDYRNFIWTSSYNSSTTAIMMDVRLNSTHALSNTVTSRGCTVRCVKVEEAELPIPAPATGITLNGNMSDWDDGDAITGDGSKIIEWKYAYDSSNLYFYFKIPTAKITAKDDGSYNNKYIYIAINTDNKSTTGVKPNYGGLTMTDCNALSLVYPFRGNTTDGLAFADGLESDSWTRCPADGSRTGKQVTVYGTINGSYAYLEMGIPWNGLGSPSPSKMKLQFSYSWDLAGIYTIEIK